LVEPEPQSDATLATAPTATVSTLVFIMKDFFKNDANCSILVHFPCTAHLKLFKSHKIRREKNLYSYLTLSVLKKIWVPYTRVRAGAGTAGKCIRILLGARATLK
jgi:hypothetical protein